MTNYREYAPPAHLQHFIDCAWLFEPGPASHASADRIFPDGAADLVVSAAGAVVFGPAPAYRLMSAQMPMFGFRIRCGAAKAILNVSPGELSLCPVSFEDLWGRSGREFAARPVDASRPTEAAALLAGFVEEQTERTRTLDEAILQTIASVRYRRACDVRRLADVAGLSERQLRRRFEDHVGLGLKHYARIVRFQSLLDSIRSHKRRFGAAAPGWAGLACDHGFADQAHLIREVKAFAGLTPGALVGLL